MDLPQSRAIVPVLEFLAESPSTNDALVSYATGPSAADWPDLAVVVTDNQTAGRGRLGRSWVSPAGRSLAISVLLRPTSTTATERAALGPERFGWLPLMAGLAMTRAVSSVIPGEAALKWPNDVLVGGLKVCGILGELLPDARGVVIGAGVNIALEADELPTDTSTSLTLAGASASAGTDVLADTVLSAYLVELSALYSQVLLSGPDSMLRAAVTERCETLGRSVRVELPSGSVLTGTAAAIDADGRLVVETNTGISTVAAGDVTHLRY